MSGRVSIRFADTRGDTPSVGWADAIDGGTAPSGGLWVPDALPRTFERAGGGADADDFREWALPRAMEWLDATVDAERIGAAFDVPVRLRALGSGIDLLDLTGGPTGAFKDLGARFLSALWSVHPRGDGRGRTVLTATSGDTGGAVAAAVEGVPGIRGVVVFPLDRVTEVQRRHFTTRGPHVRALAVRGTFDDAQAMVRAAFVDPGLVEVHGLVSANSINPGRLLPQTLYYGWLGAVAPGRPVVVPSGNLGNVTAAVIARAMGAALGAVHAVVNENDALVRAVEGRPAPTGPAVPTDSSAMDVAAPSNLERLRWLSSCTGRPLDSLVHAASVGMDRARAAQRWAWTRHGVVLDPHTSVGVARALELIEADPTTRPVVVETAHPSKFPGVVRSVLGVDTPPAPHLHREGEERWTVVEPDATALARALAEGPVP